MWLVRAASAVGCLVMANGSLRAQSPTQNAGLGKPFSNLQDSIAVNFELPQGGVGASETGFVHGMLRTVLRVNPAPQLADGRTISAASSPDLASLLGTTFGGTVPNPKVPNVAGRAIVGAGAGPGLTAWSRGTVRGTADIALTEANVPRHSHPLSPTGFTTPTGNAVPAPFNNVQPSIGLTYIIRTSGLHPAANAGAAAYLGTVVPYVGATAPAGWAFCDGAELPLAGNQVLWSVIGNNFGGNAGSTFKLPDLRGRTIVGAGERPGSSGATVGTYFGSETGNLSLATMPTHTHLISPGVTTGPAGQGFAIDNRQPSLALTYLVAEQAFFPATDALGEDVAFGEVVAFAGTSVPPGFLLADGRSIPRSANPSLSALYGSTFGGDENSFMLPDLRARTLIGAGPGVLVGPVNATALDQPLAVTVDEEGNLVYEAGETAGGSDLRIEEDNLGAHGHEVPEPASLATAALSALAAGGVWRSRKSA